MPKATIAQLTDAGFRAEQFGKPADFATPATGYLARVLADAEDWLRMRIGDALYDAATAGAGLFRATRAEKCWAASELYRRRVAFLDANAQHGLEPGANASDRAQMRKDQQEEMECAETMVQQLLGQSPDDAAQPVFGHIETGRYPSMEALAGG